VRCILNSIVISVLAFFACGKIQASAWQVARAHCAGELRRISVADIWYPRPESIPPPLLPTLTNRADPIRLIGMLVRVGEKYEILGLSDYVGYVGGGHRAIDRGVSYLISRLSNLLPESARDPELNRYLWAGEVQFTNRNGGEWELEAASEVSGWRADEEAKTGEKVNSVDELKRFVGLYNPRWLANQPRLTRFNLNRVLRGQQRLHFDDEINDYSVRLMQLRAAIPGGRVRGGFNHNVNGALNSFSVQFDSAVNGNFPMRNALNDLQRDSPLMLLFLRKLHEYHRMPPDTQFITEAISALHGLRIQPSKPLAELEREILEVEPGMVEPLSKRHQKQLKRGMTTLVDWLRFNDKGVGVDLYLGF
jgi:hypothetical protein